MNAHRKRQSHIKSYPDYVVSVHKIIESTVEERIQMITLNIVVVAFVVVVVVPK